VEGFSSVGRAKWTHKKVLAILSYTSVGKLKSLVRIKNRKTEICVRSLDPSGGQAAGNILARNFN
jgi:hypothetical protein